MQKNKRNVELKWRKCYLALHTKAQKVPLIYVISWIRLLDDSHLKDYRDLHKAIIDHVIAWAVAEFRRRTNVLNSCKTLDDLHAALTKEGYNRSRQALYLRLIPRRADSNVVKHHVRTVPGTLHKPKKTLHNRHTNADFTFATTYEMRDILSLFRSQNAFFFLVPIGLNAITKQAHLIMHVNYEIRLSVRP